MRAVEIGGCGLTVLVDLTDADFDWLDGSAEGTRGLTLPPGGAEDAAVNNQASARVLEKNRFVRTGERSDAEDGALVCLECVL